MARPGMTADDQQALRLVREALDRPADERGAFLTHTCGDAVLRGRVERLLEHAEQYEKDAAADVLAAGADGGNRHGDRLIGCRLGPFRVVQRIGSGGMGVVYRGEREDADFAQTVAIKLIRRGFDFDEVQTRFLRERRILASLSHPNLARFIDGGISTEGQPWFALEFVSGQAIDRWCDARRLDVRGRMQLLLDVCAAVQYAHTQLVVHRDLKPGNILVDDLGTVRLLDFGIARLLSGGIDDDRLTAAVPDLRAMTPEYAAPEQLGGEASGVAGDVYALGVIACELIAGVLPYEPDPDGPGRTPGPPRPPLAQVLSEAIAHPYRQAGRPSQPNAANGAAAAPAPVSRPGSVDPPGPGDAAQDAAGESPAQRRLAARSMTLRAYRTTVRGDLSRILDMALHAQPQHRYPTIAAFADDLQRWLAGAPARAVGDGFGYRLGKFVKRNALATATSGLLVAALVGTSAWALHSAWSERLQRDAALREVARSNAVHDYVMLMFGDVAQRHESGTLSARDVLQSSAAQIASRFADQPDMGQRVALALASLYSRLGDTQGAVPLLEQVLSWPGIEDNPGIQADARAQLAELEYFRSNIPRARLLLQQARDWWASNPSRHANLLNESLITLSQIERAEGDLDTAIGTLAEAIAERRALFDPPDRVLGMALNTQSVALIQVGRHDEAVQAADGALEIFRSLDQQDSEAALAAIANRATAAMHAGRIDAAERDFRQVVEQRALLHGPSPELAGVQSNLAQVLMRKNGRAEAIALWEGGLDMAITHGGEATRYALPIRGHLAEAYVAVGRIVEAERLADDAVRIALERYGETSIFVAAAMRARGAVRIAQQRYPEARADLDAATAIFTAAGASGQGALRSLQPLRALLPAP